MRKIALYAGMATLIATPLAAQQASAELARTSAPVEGASEIGGDQNTIFFILGVAAVAAAIAFLSEDDDDAPVSA